MCYTYTHTTYIGSLCVECYSDRARAPSSWFLKYAKASICRWEIHMPTFGCRNTRTRAIHIGTNAIEETRQRSRASRILAGSCIHNELLARTIRVYALPTHNVLVDSHSFTCFESFVLHLCASASACAHRTNMLSLRLASGCDCVTASMLERKLFNW